MTEDIDPRLLDLKQKSLKRCIELLDEAIKNGTLVRINTKPITRPLRDIDAKQP